MSCSSTTYWFDKTQLLKRNLRLPELALDTLTMNGNMPSQGLCISLAIAGSPSQLFYAAPSQPILRLTLEKNEMYTRTTTHITISCKSLKHLSVKLDTVILEMEFDEEGQALESSSTEIAQLKTEKQAIVAKYEQAKKYLTKAQIQKIEE